MSHYDVLGVSPSADADALHEAYLRLARRHHPDRTGGDAGRMQAINEAWSVLGDPQRRTRYDLALDSATAARGAASPTGAPSRPEPRRGYEPDPAYDPYDDIDHDRYEPFYDVGYAGQHDEDVDDFGGYDFVRADPAAERSATAARATVSLPRWLRLMPMATFVSSIAVFVIAVVFASEPLFALALMTFFLACLFFLAAPFMALLLSRRPPTARRE